MPGMPANDRRGAASGPGLSLVSPRTDPMVRTGCGAPVRHLLVGAWRTETPGLSGLQRCYEENAKIVVELKVWPAPSTVDGKLAWLGESGKCWVSKVYAWPWR